MRMEIFDINRGSNEKPNKALSKLNNCMQNVRDDQLCNNMVLRLIMIYAQEHIVVSDDKPKN
jgi:hypothetical protein